jgi:signal transduction histidine kinase
MLLDGTMGKMTKDQTQQVQEIYDGNQRMIELVNSLLDVSRLDLGKLINTPAPTDMTELAASLEKELATSIKGKNMKFEKHIQHKLAPVSADPKLLRMILQNLLSNAVKYTPAKGTVTLTMRPATKAEIQAEKLHTAEPCLFISVTDTGYGIPKEQQHRIFEKMFRADNVRKMDVEGTGLGLYIVREVAQKLGGNIRFESKESIGTTFYVILPFITKSSQLPDSSTVVK